MVRPSHFVCTLTTSHGLHFCGWGQPHQIAECRSDPLHSWACFRKTWIALGSIFPKARGNIASKNEQGQAALENILMHPESYAEYRHLPRYGNIIDVKIAGREGARFYRDGRFIGFLEP